ncbi:hypothetical protein FRC17_005962, partial [Serendipita sp. 399]
GHLTVDLTRLRSAAGPLHLDIPFHRQLKRARRPRSLRLFSPTTLAPPQPVRAQGLLSLTTLAPLPQPVQAQGLLSPTTLALLPPPKPARAQGPSLPTFLPRILHQ